MTCRIHTGVSHTPPAVADHPLVEGRRHVVYLRDEQGSRFLTPEQARKIARGLLDAADDCDKAERQPRAVA